MLSTDYRPLHDSNNPPSGHPDLIPGAPASKWYGDATPMSPIYGGCTVPSLNNPTYVQRVIMPWDH